MKRTELKRKTPLKAKTPLRARTPLARSSLPLKRAPLVQKRIKPKLQPARKRKLVERSAGCCELVISDICQAEAVDVAHRIGEGMGGRHGEAAERNDRLSNVLHSCRDCHQWCHRNPVTAQL